MYFHSKHCPKLKNDTELKIEYLIKYSTEKWLMKNKKISTNKVTKLQIGSPKEFYNRICKIKMVYNKFF